MMEQLPCGCEPREGGKRCSEAQRFRDLRDYARDCAETETDPGARSAHWAAYHRRMVDLSAHLAGQRSC
jgi:hypothetical protein